MTRFRDYEDSERAAAEYRRWQERRNRDAGIVDSEPAKRRRSSMGLSNRTKLHDDDKMPFGEHIGEPLHLTRDRLDARDPQPDDEISLLAAGVILVACAAGLAGFVVGCVVF